MTEETGQPEDSAALQAQQGGFQEARRLQKFFTRLFGEALHLGVDTITFSGTSETITASLSRSDAVLKEVPIKAAWFEPMTVWLAQRAYSPVEWAQREPVKIKADEVVREFPCSVRTSDGFVQCQVKIEVGLGGKKTLVLSEIGPLSEQKVYEGIGIGNSAQILLQEILNHGHGLVALAFPGSSREDLGLQATLSVCGYTYLGDLAEHESIESIVELAAAQNVAVSLKSFDALEALLELRRRGFELGDEIVRGVWCQAFTKRTCIGCARAAALDTLILADLPPALRLPSDHKYFVGRGCDDCGLSGYRGLLGLQSVIHIDSESLELFRNNPRDEELADYFYQRGTRALLEDGISKVKQGVLTFESLFQIVRSVPELYEDQYNAMPRETSDHSEPMIQVSEDFFAQEGEAPAEQPVPGREAFKQEPQESLDDSAPLFQGARRKIVREKPLVYVVEDDPDQAKILEMVLSSANYEVQMAGDGVDAIELVEAELPDLIISDLMMPRMDGAELVNRLKSHPVYKEIPVLVLTVVNDVDKEYALLDNGADDYCAKTIQRKILLKRVENLLRRNN